MSFIYRDGFIKSAIILNFSFFLFPTHSPDTLCSALHVHTTFIENFETENSPAQGLNYCRP